MVTIMFTDILKTFTEPEVAAADSTGHDMNVCFLQALVLQQPEDRRLSY